MRRRCATARRRVGSRRRWRPAGAVPRRRRPGLGVNAGHDLSQANLAAFLAAVPGVLEVSIGHALIAEALVDGLAETVRRYRAITGG